MIRDGALCTHSRAQASMLPVFRTRRVKNRRGSLPRALTPPLTHVCSMNFPSDWHEKPDPVRQFGKLLSLLNPPSNSKSLFDA